MKWISLGLLSLLTLVSSCGKNNESGKSNNPYSFNNPLINPYTGQVMANPYSTINSPYSYNGWSLNQAMTENPCVGSMYGNARLPLQIPLVNFPTVISPNDVYLGVTSFGDVAALVGQGVGQPPLFVGYMCPRDFAPTGQGQLMGINIGAYTNCYFKAMTAATIVFPGGATAEFRMADFGSSMRQKFTFCR